MICRIRKWQLTYHQDANALPSSLARHLESCPSCQAHQQRYDQRLERQVDVKDQLVAGRSHLVIAAIGERRGAPNVELVQVPPLVIGHDGHGVPQRLKGKGFLENANVAPIVSEEGRRGDHQDAIGAGAHRRGLRLS